jgi:hypothetical protein
MQQLARLRIPLRIRRSPALPPARFRQQLIAAALRLPVHFCSDLDIALPVALGTNPAGPDHPHPVLALLRARSVSAAGPCTYPWFKQNFK